MGANDWKILELVPKTQEDEKGARESIQCVLNALEVRVLLRMRIGPYTFQEETEGVAGLIGTGKMVADAVYFNRVQRAPYWYTLSGENTIVEVRHVLQTGLQMQEISGDNQLPRACNRTEATRQRALKVRSMDHDAIMEGASRRDRLEYNNNNDDNKDDESEEESEEESESGKE